MSLQEISNELGNIDNFWKEVGEYWACEHNTDVEWFESEKQALCEKLDPLGKKIKELERHIVDPVYMNIINMYNELAIQTETIKPIDIVSHYN